MIDAKDGQSRHDAINAAAQGDTGGGVVYQVQYSFRRDPSAQPVWLEDTGRWFAAPDGKPIRAQGVLRAIDERHAREAELLKLAKFDQLTGEMNRLHLTEVLGATLDGSDTLSYLLRVPAGRHRSSCQSQRSLRLRHRRGGHRAGRQAHPRPPARQGLFRPLLGQQIRRHLDKLHAGRTGGRGRPAAGRRA